MSVLIECPHCHFKQSLSHKKCKCNADLDKLKKSQKVKYWIDYRVDGKQRREPVGFLLEEARAADGKRKSQIIENRIFEIMPDAKMTFGELIEWYLGLKSVKKLKSFERVEDALDNFKKAFGNKVVSTIKPLDLENYQVTREEDGKAPATIDMELTIAKTVVNKAFDNDLVGGRTLKAFRSIKRKLKRGSNARDRKLSIEEYVRLLGVASDHLRGILIIAMNTGMRKGEIFDLKWSYIDMKGGFIRLPKEATKEKQSKSIPINSNVKKVLGSLPRALHHDSVITYRGKPVDMGLRKSMIAACKAAGIEFGMNKQGGLRFHDIRGTVKTNMLKAGIDKALRDKLLGHSLQGMDAFYLKFTDDDLRQAMDTYTKWLDQQVKKIKVDQSVDQGPISEK